jgi:hypothetical protein
MPSPNRPTDSCPTRPCSGLPLSAVLGGPGPAGHAGNSGNQLSLIGPGANSSCCAGTWNGRATACMTRRRLKYFPDAHHLPLHTSLDDNGFLNGLETTGREPGGECWCFLLSCACPICTRSFFSHLKSVGSLTRGSFGSSRVPPETRSGPFPQHDQPVGWAKSMRSRRGTLCTDMTVSF